MNNKRRKELKELYFQFQQLQERIEAVLEEEQESFENLPENLQWSENGRKSEDAIDRLDDCRTDIESIVYNLAEILDY